MMHDATVKKKYIFSFLHGFWYIDLTMTRKMGRNSYLCNTVLCMTQLLWIHLFDKRNENQQHTLNPMNTVVRLHHIQNIDFLSHREHGPCPL
jgi:hypothetical protein